MAASTSGTRLVDHVDDDQDDGCRGERTKQKPGHSSVQCFELGVRPCSTGVDERSRLGGGLSVLDERTPYRYRRDNPQDVCADHPAVPRMKLGTQDGEPDPQRDRSEETKNYRNRSDHLD